MAIITIRSKGGVAALVMSALWTSPVAAHVKWFSDPAPESSHNLPEATTLIVVGVLLVTGLLLAKVVDAVAHQFSLTPRRLYSRSTRPLRLVYYLIAVYFLGAAITNTFLAPHIRVPESVLYAGVGVQLVIYSGLLLDRGRGLCAFLIVLLFIVAGVSDPLFMIEYPLLLALAWIVLFADERPSPLGLLLVRSLLGLSLVSLAFTEKLNDPLRALSLLEQYDFNFMAQAGFSYSDRLFVYSAGLVELLIGLVLLMGWVSRLTVMVLFIFMIATNSYFFAIGEHYMAWVELIGHLPIFACGILLLFYQPAPVARKEPVNRRDEKATMPTAPGRLR